MESPNKIIVGCPTSLKEQSILRVIENKNKQNPKFECNSCPRAYTCARTFKRHLASRHGTQGDAKFVCMICKTVVRFPNISNHMQANHALTGKADFITQNITSSCDEKDMNEGNNGIDSRTSRSTTINFEVTEIRSESPVHKIKTEFGATSEEDSQKCDVSGTSSEKVAGEC